MQLAYAAGRPSKRRTRWRRGPGSCTTRRARRPSPGSSVRETHGDAARAERLLELAEAPIDRRAAELAGAVRAHAVGIDAVPVALDQRLVARRAVGRTARAVVHVAGVDVVE